MPSYPNSQTLLLLECFRTVGDQDIKGAECVCVCGGGGVLGGVEKVMMMAPVQPLPPLPPCPLFLPPSRFQWMCRISPAFTTSRATARNRHNCPSVVREAWSLVIPTRGKVRSATVATPVTHVMHRNACSTSRVHSTLPGSVQCAGSLYSCHPRQQLMNLAACLFCYFFFFVRQAASSVTARSTSVFWTSTWARSRK